MPKCPKCNGFLYHDFDIDELTPKAKPDRVLVCINCGKRIPLADLKKYVHTWRLAA